MKNPPRPSAQGGRCLAIIHSERLGSRLALGASVAVSGVCLTVVELGDGWSRVELSPETLAKSTLGALAAGSEVNLETPLRLGDPLGGHWVQGHVDTTTAVVARRDLGEHRVLSFAVPDGFAAAFVDKGSVAIDGVSLTIAERRADSFEVALIPHTLEVTTLGALGPGCRVNLEVDVLGKYVQQAVAVWRPT